MDAPAPETPTVAPWWAALDDASPEQRRAAWLAARESGAEMPDDGLMLDGVDLGPKADRRAARLPGAYLKGAKLRSAILRRVDLSGADLTGASLGQADLRGANLEWGRLGGADLVGAKLARAHMDKVDLRDALLEDADLRRASLRFAEMRGAVLEGANLAGADLWSIRLEAAELAGADLRRAIIKEADLRDADLARCDLRRADLSQTNLRGASLRGADLRGARLDGVDLSGGDLSDAKLDGVDLSRTNLSGVKFDGAELSRTRMRLDQLGDRIGEESERRFAPAARAYLALDRNFSELGDHDSARWAYLRRRRMEKLAELDRAREAWRARRWRDLPAPLAAFASDQAVEWLCDYGESVPRVLLTLLAVVIVFSGIYGVCGSVLSLSDGPDGPATVRAITRNPLELVVFSLMAMTTSGNPAVGLVPSHEAVHLLTGLQASIGIALTGLLGFVLGNRIRR